MKTDNKKIVLIALDYDETAVKVAESGFMLAKNMGAEVILMHVVSDPVYYETIDHVTVMGFAGNPETSPMPILNTGDVKKVSRHFLDKSKNHLGDPNIRTLVTEGDYADSILKTSADLQVDIIVMGSHSKRWLDEILMGSVTERVLHHTTIPLFIIPTKLRK
jgi:nucleotide-binding universal stress UspA family protein